MNFKLFVVYLYTIWQLWPKKIAKLKKIVFLGHPIPHSISIVKVSSATLPQGVVGWRQVTTTRRSQVSRLVAIQGVPSQSYVQRCF